MQELVGNKYNKLTVLSLYEIRQRADSKRKRYFYKCLCDCGNIVIVEKSHLIGGHTKSCGCERKKENSGQFKKKYNIDEKNKNLYYIFRGMNVRCNNINDKHFKNYGARGIKVIWNNFIDFYNWAVNNGYKKGLTIDRIDVNGNYCPENCRWTDSKTQNRNKRNNHIITVFGESLPVSELCEKYNVNKNSVFYRIRAGKEYISLFARTLFD